MRSGFNVPFGARGNIPKPEQVAIATATIMEIEALLAGPSEHLDVAAAHSVLSVAYHERAMSRIGDRYDTAEDLLAYVWIRKDLMQAWEHARKAKVLRGH